MEVYRPEAAFDMNLLTFKLFGVWPSSVKHPLLRFIYKIYGYAIHLCYIGGHLPTQFSSMYIMRGDMKELVDNSFFTLTCIGYASKLIVFILQRKKLEEFFDRLKNPLFFPKRKKHLDVLNEYTISARTNTAIYISLVLATCTTWIIFPLVDSKQEKTLLFPAWYPYNTTVNPAYEYTYVCQTILLLTTATMNSMIDMLTLNFYVIMVGHMETLKLDFRELTDFLTVNNIKNFNNNEYFMENINWNNEKYIHDDLIFDLTNFCQVKETKISSATYLESTSSGKNDSNCIQSLEIILNNRIIKCTLRYQAILKFVKDVTNFFQIGIIVQVCTSSIIICTTTYEMTTISPSTLQFYMFLQYQICIMYQIFLYAWRGNDITLKTIELRDAIYECGWITVPNIKFRRSLYIIMSRLQVPLTLCVGKFFLLSVDTFFKIIKIAYTFYVLLKQVNAKKTTTMNV